MTKWIMSFSQHLSVRHCVRLSVVLLQSDTKFRHLIREKVKQNRPSITTVVIGQSLFWNYMLPVSACARHPFIKKKIKKRNT